MPAVSVNRPPTAVWEVTLDAANPQAADVLAMLEMMTAIAPLGYRTIVTCSGPTPALAMVITRDGYPSQAASSGDYVVTDGKFVIVCDQATYQQDYAASTGPPAAGPAKGLLAGVTYSQSAVSAGLNAADYANMNNGSADGSANSNETGVDPPDGWIMADCGAVVPVAHVVLGLDFMSNLPGNWGPAAFNGATLSGSADKTTWTAVGTCDSGTATNGLVSIPVNADYRYLKVTAYPGAWLALTEFEVWGPVNVAPTIERVLQ